MGCRGCLVDPEQSLHECIGGRDLWPGCDGVGRGHADNAIGVGEPPASCAPCGYLLGVTDPSVTDLGSRIVRSTDNSVHQWLPAEVAAPHTAAEVVGLVRDNNARSSPLAVCARGGGTSTNGQSLGEGLVIDTKQHLDRIIDIDPEARRATVEPGVVAGRLDDALAPFGLFWAPHTSTRNRATVGGMIATDAAGKGSLVHGRTNRHVESVDLVLADGTTWTARALPLDEATVEAERIDTIGQIWRVLLALSGASTIGLPELARGFSGYGISRVHRNGMVDPVPIICGAEGTLGIVVRATLILTPLPTSTTLIVVGYPTLGAALDDAVLLAGHHAAPSPSHPSSLPLPSAIEVSDRTTLDHGAASPAWPQLRRYLPAGSEAMLLCEYDTAAAAIDATSTIEAVTKTFSESGRSIGHAVVDNAADRAAIWKVRADAVGLLAKVSHGQPRPTAFVEDCAVPVADMPAFIAEFAALLDAHGLGYAMFGHADVGCVHVRPALDPISQHHEDLISELTSEVVALLDRFGGILWGEHGRGLRSSLVSNVLPPDTIALMRAVKTAFDPRDRMNPGKLYRPLDNDTPLLGLADVPRRASFDRGVPVTIRADYSHAFDCNGNGLCHHYGGSEVMCPSFKITNDPRQAPKGRADLIRAWLHAKHAQATDPRDLADTTEAVMASMQTCLSCGACTGHCPVAVDVPELKSRFLEAYHRNHRRPLRDHVLARLETVIPLVRHLPGRNSAALRWSAARIGLVALPTIPASSADETELRSFDIDDVDIDIVVLADVFTSVLDRNELIDAVALLERVGYRTAVSRLVPTAKFEHVKGMRTRFAKAAGRQQALLERIEGAGAVPVSLDPALVLMHRHDYAKVVPDYPGQAVRPIVDLLVDFADRLPRTDHPRRVDLFGHCTEQALAPQWIDSWARLLTAVGHDVRRVETGCCGMAGVFGHEAENAAMSTALFDQLWRPHLDLDADGGEPAIAVATGWSCRSQADRHGSRVVSPLALLAEDLPVAPSR